VKESKLAPNMECKTNTNMGECIYKKTQVPFCVEAKVDIKPYVREVDSIKLNHWPQKMEVYFSVHDLIKKQNIAFAWLKLEDHALGSWESDPTRRELQNDPPVIDWEVFKDMIEAHFYPIEEHQQIVWNYFKKRQGQSLEEFMKRKVQLGFSLKIPNMIIKYLGAFLPYI